MREKRVNLLVLTCSLVVATCASVSYCSVTSFKIDGYATILCAAIPLLLGGHISPASGATVWIPSEEAIDTDGSVNDEFLEVSHVFGRPDTKVVKPKEGDEITELPVPFVSMKKEWEIYKKIQNSKRKKDKAGSKEAEDEDENADDDGSSEEEDDAENVEHPGENYDGEDGEEEEDHEEDDDGDDEPEGRSSIQPSSTSEVARSSAKSIYPKFVSNKNEQLPLAFFGQENHDDDESDFLKAERRVFKKPKSNQKKASDEEDDNEEDDVSGSVEDAASLEDYADYAADDENNENEDGGQQRPIHNPQQQSSQNQGPRFEDIPLAIREMILNDLASQNNGSGFSPNLTPQVTQGVQQGLPQGGPQGVPQNVPVKQEQDDDASDEENSSEEEDDNNAAEVIRGHHPADPTPPAIRPTPKQTKGDDDEEDEVYDDGGKGKGKKGKKKKGKKGKGGWEWKPQGWGHVHIPTGWGHKEEKGWGWDPSKHDGVLEQMVRGSTWERVLKYYHWKRDQAIKEEGHHGHHDDHHHHHHHEEHGGLEFGHGPHEEHHHDDHYHHKPTGIKKIVNKAFKGSFWERAFHTYAKYKEEQAKNPKKPAVIDLDTHHGLDVKMH